MSNSSYQLYKEYKETPETKKIYTQINELRSLLRNYNENSPNSKKNLEDINRKAKELYQQYKNFNNLKMHINKLIMFMSNHTREFKEMQHDFYEVKELVQQSQSGDAIHMDVAVNTPYGNLSEKLLKTSNKRQRTSAEGKTKRRKRKKIDFKKFRKHITQRLKPRFKTRFKLKRIKTSKKKK